MKQQLVLKCYISKNKQPKEPYFFMPHASSQNEHLLWSHAHFLKKKLPSHASFKQKITSGEFKIKYCNHTCH
jgi:hypothetical protein